MTVVVNLRSDDYDAYIGRGSLFGNPWSHITHKETKAEFTASSREESIDKYREYFKSKIREDSGFREEVLKLKDKKLGCYCKPLACHGDIIKEWLDDNA